MSLLGVLCIFKGHHWPPPNWSIHRSIKLADIQTIGQFLTPLVGALTGFQFDNLLPYRGSVEVYSFSLKYVSPPHPVLGERSSCHSDRHAMTVCVQSYIQMRISTWNGKKLNIFVASAHRTAYRYVGNEFPAEFASWPGVKRKRWRRCRWQQEIRCQRPCPLHTMTATELSDCTLRWTVVECEPTPAVKFTFRRCRAYTHTTQRAQWIMEVRLHIKLQYLHQSSLRHFTFAYHSTFVYFISFHIIRYSCFCCK